MIEAITLPNGIEAFRVDGGLIFARLEAAVRFSARLAAKVARAAVRAAKAVRGTLARTLAPVIQAVAEIRRNPNTFRRTWSIRVRKADGTTTPWKRIADVPARLALKTGRAIYDLAWYPAEKATV